MGCCGAAPEGCDILRDDFSRDSLETLTFSSQSSTTYGWAITMTSTPTACTVGDTITGESLMDYQDYSYYVSAVSGDTVTVEFLYVETPDESLDPDPETQGITSFTVKRLGSNYAVSDTSQPANYLYGVCSNGLVASNTSGEHGDRSWLRLTPLDGKQNFKLSTTLHHYGTTSHVMKIHTMTDESNVDDYHNGVEFYDNTCTTCTTTDRAYIQFAGKYKYPTGSGDNARKRDPFNNLEGDTYSEVASYQSSANTIPVNGVYFKDDGIPLEYCQKEYVDSILFNRLNLSASLNYVSATATVGIPNGLALVGATTMYGLNPSNTSYGGGELSNKTFIKNTEHIQATSLVVQYNDRQAGKRTCGACIADLTCTELQNLPQYIDSRDRDVSQTVYDLGFTPSEVTTHSANKTITYNSSTEKRLYQSGLGAAAEVVRGNLFEIPEISESGGIHSYSMIDDRIGETYGLYSVLDVTFNANDSYVDNGFRIGVDASGNGYYSLSSNSTPGLDITYDSRIILNDTYTVGWCLIPVTVSLPPNKSMAVVWRYTSWIEGEDWVIA